MNVSTLFEDDPFEGSVDEDFEVEEVQCEICYQIIGRIRLDLVGVPLTGGMILPKQRNYPNIFVSNPDWEFIRCPYCQKRPFIEKDSFVNAVGERICLSH